VKESGKIPKRYTVKIGIVPVCKWAIQPSILVRANCAGYHALFPPG
jgi:hypothetical protein